MSFALVAFEASALDNQGPNQRRAVQRVVLHVTGQAADVALDIGDDSGTFWTDALANSTYGELATQALAQLKRVVAISDNPSDIFCPEILPKAQAAAVAAGVYTLALQDKRPNFTFNAGEGETAYTVKIDYFLKPEQYPILKTFGTLGG